MTMFDDIRPYDDAETAAALKRASNNRLMEQISAFLFPGKDPDILRNTLNTIHSVDDFQTRVMYPAVKSIISKTTKGLSYEGLDYFRGGSCYTMLSSHRDIVLDSAFIQYILKDNYLPLTEIAVGDNLIYNQFVEDLMRSNRMIKVARTTSPHEAYESSCKLSAYIRNRLQDENPASVWISHRNGRTKDGFDQTEQGLLKMLSLSGEGDFVENMSGVRIMPVSISYEIEPCGIRKAYETYIKKVKGMYVKRPGEDLESIVYGIVQYKGRVHVAFCKPVTVEELSECSGLAKNERFRALARIIDDRILESWKIWPTNIAALELLEGRPASNKPVTEEFEKNLAEDLRTLPLSGSRKAIKEILIRIYATPAMRKGL